jgi:hypothetical protein
LSVLLGITLLTPVAVAVVVASTTGAASATAAAFTGVNPADGDVNVIC